MRASISDAPSAAAQISTDGAAERTTRAAYLLREALDLLGSDLSVAALLSTKRQGDRLLRLPDVQHLTGLRRSAIYEQMRRGVFPRSVKAGPRAATWSEAAVQGWISDRLREQSS